MAHLEKWKSEEGKASWARTQLYDSVVGSGDFSRYEICVDQFANRRLADAAPKTGKEIRADFVDSLTKRQKEAWENWHKIKETLDAFDFLTPEERQELLPKELWNADFRELRLEAEEDLRKKFRKGTEKYDAFESVMERERQPHHYDDSNHFDGNLARRWMLQKVLELGWTSESFGDFDSHRDSNNRRSNKPERIGKKYQWIAYRELLARLSDNFARVASGSDSEDAIAEPVERDLDPSMLLHKSASGPWEPYSTCWWFPIAINQWDDPIEELDWLKAERGLPDPKEIIHVVNPDDSSEWLSLHGHYEWSQAEFLSPSEAKRGRREIWYMLKGYLVHEADADRIMEWGQKQSWMNDWMPSCHGMSHVHLGEYPWAESFKAIDNRDHGREGWTRNGDGRVLPAEVLVAFDKYQNESGGLDCSVDNTVQIDLPCRFLVEGMGMHWNGRESEWFDEGGTLVAIDPSVRLRGPGALLVRKSHILQFLKSQGLSLFWTILGEKRKMSNDLSREEYKGHLEMNGAYCLKDDEIVGATRSRYLGPPG